MALDFAEIQTELPALFEALMGISCNWRDQAVPFVDGPQAFLDVLAPAAVGVDDLRWSEVGVDAEDPTLPDTIQATMVGNREMTIQVTVWNDRQPLDVSARYYLERLRTRLRFPSTLEAMRALGLAQVRTEAMIDLDPTEDGRVMSQTSMDLRLAYVVAETDDAQPYLLTPRVKSESLRDAAGDPTLQIDINPPEP